MFQIEQKKCKGTRNVLLWHIMVLNCHVCLVWPYVTLYGLLWPFVASYGLDVAFNGHDYVCVALFELARPCVY